MPGLRTGGGTNMLPAPDFQRALDLLITDRSPRSCTRTLSDRELRMLVFAQMVRGTRYQPCRPAFLRHLRDRIARG